MPMPLNTIASVIARIRAWAAANNWSKSRYASEVGLVDTTLRRFHDESWNPTRETLEQLERPIPASWQLGDPAPVVPGNAAHSAVEGASAAVSAVPVGGDPA